MLKQLSSRSFSFEAEDSLPTAGDSGLGRIRVFLGDRVRDKSSGVRTLAGLGFLILGERMKLSVAGPDLAFFALIFAESLAWILTVTWNERGKKSGEEKRWGRKYRVNKSMTSKDK